MWIVWLYVRECVCVSVSVSVSLHVFVGVLVCMYVYGMISASWAAVSLRK
jgi:hypothetical protein